MLGKLMGWARILVLLGFTGSFVAVAASVYADADTGAALARQGDAAVGIPPCEGCHGPSGGGVASVAPRLAGLSKTYILRQLAAFRTGARRNAIMQPIVKVITPAEANDLADYFSSATAGSQTTPAPANAVVKGKEIAEHGRWADGLPACQSCHAPNGIGVAPDFPYLAGQQPEYIVDQINNWRTGERGAGPLGLMKAIADKLDDTSTAAVAAYYGSLAAPKRQGELR